MKQLWLPILWDQERKRRFQHRTLVRKWARAEERRQLVNLAEWGVEGALDDLYDPPVAVHRRDV